MKCTKCKTNKPKSEFYSGKTHTANRCKSCMIKEAKDWRQQNPIRTLFLGARNRAKKKNVPFTITFDYLQSVWDKQEGQCALSGIPFDTTTSNRKFVYNPYWASLDRIEPNKGYSEGNIRFILFSLNTALSNHGLEHYLEVAKRVSQRCES